MCIVAASAANGLSGCAPSPNAGLGDHWPVPLAQRAALRVGGGGEAAGPRTPRAGSGASRAGSITRRLFLPNGIGL